MSGSFKKQGAYLEVKQIDWRGFERCRFWIPGRIFSSWGSWCQHKYFKQLTTLFNSFFLQCSNFKRVTSHLCIFEALYKTLKYLRGRCESYICFARYRWPLHLTKGYYCANTSGTLRHFAVYSWCTLDPFFVTGLVFLNLLSLWIQKLSPDLCLISLWSPSSVFKFKHTMFAKTTTME